ncbi:CbiX/SirB N-terminal domain-containing protein [Candidatus Albibeggiatoa sp. nov. BB20]|uniref:sirohydrochlorin chelatase n=1 Tax=Candidatus Albibeggiatoa sp. nov. BB20 TaxID=3162723 RepID=UPI003365A300
MSATSLLIVAHGSRRPKSNLEVQQLTQIIREKACSKYLSIAHAFLELAEPSIGDAIDQCVRQGATDILLLPYFLSAGRHVQQDIPEEVAAKQTQYPQIKINIMAYLGASEAIPEMMLSLVDNYEEN